MKSSTILLADGTTFRGHGFGAPGTTIGEFVFHTGMSGYQEILTDPSYCGQVVSMTYPEIGNTGINHEDMESDRAWLSGFVVRNLSPVVSNWRARQSLASFLAEQNVVGITGVPTRALTLRLREHGAMMGMVSDELTLDEMRHELQAAEPIENRDLVGEVSTREPYFWNEGTWDLEDGFRDAPAPRFRVVALDYGIKRNILRLLAEQGCEVEVVPADTDTEAIMKRKPQGVFLSNGPGDPRRRPDLSENIKPLIGQIPIFGICYGFQILGPALGAQVDKLRFGHHGANHPVRHDNGAGVWITSQNHNYVVRPETLPQGCSATDINLNDQTLEGFRDTSKGVLAIQYHPEASPGPHDAVGVFAEFAEMMQAWRK